MMRFYVDKQKFLEKLTIVKSVAEKRTTMPILSSILLSTKQGDNPLFITATDMETTIVANVDIDFNGDVPSDNYGIAVSAHKLFEIVQKLPDGNIEVNQKKNNWIELKMGNGKYKMAGISHTDFPQIPTYTEDDFFTIDSSMLNDMISKTVPYVPTDDFRRNLCGIFLEKSDEDKIRLVATDGHRLSFVENSLIDDVKLSENVIIPKKAFLELKKISKQYESIKMKVQDSFFVAYSEDIIIFSRLIIGDYPDYRKVIPDETKFELEIDRKEFLSSLKRINVFASKISKAVHIIFDNNSMAIESATDDVGEAKEVSSVDYSDKLLKVRIDGNYLIDALESIDQEYIIFKFSDELSPVIIKPKDTENHMCIIMPMRD